MESSLRLILVSRDSSCSLTALTGADACCLPVGRGFLSIPRYAIVNLAAANVHALFLGPHATFLSHHPHGEVQLAVFDDLIPSQHDHDAPVEPYISRATIHHHHATVLIQEPDVVASRCYFNPPEVVPLLTVAFCSPL